MSVQGSSKGRTAASSSEVILSFFEKKEEGKRGKEEGQFSKPLLYYNYLLFMDTTPHSNSYSPKHSHPTTFKHDLSFGKVIMKRSYTSEESSCRRYSIRSENSVRVFLNMFLLLRRSLRIIVYHYQY